MEKYILYNCYKINFDLIKIYKEIEILNLKQIVLTEEILKTINQEYSFSDKENNLKVYLNKILFYLEEIENNGIEILDIFINVGCALHSQAYTGLSIPSVKLKK